MSTRRQSSFLSVASFLGLTVIAHAREPVAPPFAAATAINALACDLYADLRQGEGTLCFSPLSIATALAMTYAGAGGDTAKQMERALHLAADPAATHAAFGDLVKQIAKAPKTQSKGFSLRLANALWVQKGATLYPAFSATLRDAYAAEAQLIDFQTRPEAERLKINAWVEKATHFKILEIVSPGAIRAETRAILTNALYFRAAWAGAFEEKGTQDVSFHLAPDKVRPVPTMARTDELRYAETGAMQVLELPYLDTTLAMVIFLPRAKDGLAALERTLSPSLLAAQAEKLVARQVAAFVPRFKVRHRLDLDSSLSRLGMTAAFGESVDFSGVDGSRDLFLDAVLHETFVAIDEEGTEAAAATAIEFGAAEEEEPPPPPVMFLADHPFLFVIRDRKDGLVYFIGRVVDPSA